MGRVGGSGFDLCAFMPFIKRLRKKNKEIINKLIKKKKEKEKEKKNKKKKN